MSSVKYDPKEMGNMLPEEYEIALQLCENDPEFKGLWDEHRELKQRLNHLNEKGRLTAEEELEIKKLKRVKLAGKDKIAQRIRDFKVSVAPPK